MKSIMEASTILLCIQLIPLFLFSLSALACAPAPTCWMGSSREYLKSVCINSTRSPDMLKYVEEPEQIGNFVQACAKLGIKVKAPTGSSPAAPRSIYCDEQATKKERDYCWAHGGDPTPGGRVDRCIKALPVDMQFFKKVELCS